jgi:HD superfamily phosphohydrolase
LAACLLHDSGHTLFSHIGEKFYETTPNKEAFVNQFWEAAGVVETKYKPQYPRIVMNSKVGADWIKEWQSKAEARGMKRGVAKGEVEALAQVARNLKSSGMSDKLVSQYTGLSLTKIKKL